MKLSKSLVAASVASAAVMFGAASAAPVTFGTITTDDSNFADSVALVSGGSELVAIDGEAGGNANATVGRDGPNLDIIRCQAGIACSFDVFFDGGVQNQAGDDIAIFGLGGDGSIPEEFSLTINGVTLSNLELVQTGVILGTDIRPQGYNIKQLVVDLSSFGLAVGESINSIRVAVAAGVDSEEFAAFASLNDDTVVTPLPAAFLMFLGGAAGLAGAGRKKKKA